MQHINENAKLPLTISFESFENWEEFLIFSREVKQDDLFIIISSRKGYLSYHSETEKLPKYLTKYFARNSYIILYPQQTEDTADENLKSVEENAELLNKAEDYVKSMFASDEDKTKNNG